MKRVASVIRVPEESIEEYERLHADVWPSVLEQITACNIRNYSIYRYGELLFSYFEYVGTDYEADMEANARHPETQRWWALTAPLQEGLPERAQGEWWMALPEVFHAD